MSFSLSLLLIIYIIFLIVWFIMSAIALYHMLKFGFLGFTTIATSGLYIALSVFILTASFQYLAAIDWSAEVEIMGPGTKDGIGI